MFGKQKIKLLIALIVLISFYSTLNSQTVEDAWKSYTAAKTAQNDGNFSDAIMEYNACLEICKHITNQEKKGEIEKLNSSIGAVLPSLYLQMGEKNLGEQKLEEALANSLKAKELSIPAKDTCTLRKTNQLIPTIYYQLGVSKLNQNELDAALSDMNSAIKYEPDYLNAYYLKAYIYKKKNDDALLKSACLKGLQESDRLNDKNSHEKIRDLAFQYFLRKGLAKKNEQYFKEAANLLSTALEFNKSDLTTLYLLTTTYNSLALYSEAIKTGETALTYETGNDEAKARFYLVIGESYAKQGNTNQACATFKKAAVGQYADYANHYMKYTLKCQE
jgi:tetratricopeptide (TPR) repeat protein